MKIKKRGNVLWSSEETSYFEQLVTRMKRHYLGLAPINWDVISGQLNIIHKNKRTPKACERKYAFLKPNAFDRRWSKEEMDVLSGLIQIEIAQNKLIMWEFVSEKLNKRFKHNRTPYACKQKYYDSIRQPPTTRTFKVGGGIFSSGQGCY